MAKTGRPDLNKRVQTGTGDLGPGAYGGGKEFGKDVRGHSFGKPKPEKPIVDPRDYGYEPVGITRARSPAARINARTPARPDIANPSQADNSAGPGSYPTQKNFGEGVKGHGFGKPRPEKTIVDDRDYNTGMDLEKTRAKSPAAFIRREKSRPDTFANQANEESVGPGAYDDGKEFGKGLKNMSFSKTAREKPQPESTGPG